MLETKIEINVPVHWLIPAEGRHIMTNEESKAGLKELFGRKKYL